MGVVDIRNALSNAAGDQFTFREVKLGYAEGGRKQVLSFKVNCKDSSFTLDQDQKFIFSGQMNPIDKAIEIATSYKEQLEGK